MARHRSDGPKTTPYNPLGTPKHRDMPNKGKAKSAAARYSAERTAIATAKRRAERAIIKEANSRKDSLAAEKRLAKTGAIRKGLTQKYVKADRTSYGRRAVNAAQQSVWNAESRRQLMQNMEDAEAATMERRKQIMYYQERDEADRRALENKDLQDPTLSNPAEWLDDIIL